MESRVFDIPEETGALPRRIEMTDVWTELYSPKQERIANRREGPFGRCDECGQFRGRKVTREDLIRLAESAIEQEKWVRSRADRYWTALQTATGKLAMLRHENNKLRRANERLMKQVRAE